MGVKFNQIISLPELKDLKLVSGRKGLSKIIRWVHSLETPDLVKYAQNDDLIMMTGIGVAGDILSFVKLVNGLVEKKAAGLILNTGKYFEQVPEEIKKLSEENAFPVFEVPWEKSLAEVTKIICGNIIKKHLEESLSENLLKNILLLNRVTYEDFTERILTYGYSYLSSFRIIIVTIDRLQQYLCSKKIEDEEKVMQIKDEFLKLVNRVIWNSKYQPISFLHNDAMILLIINEKDRQINLTTISQVIRENIKLSFPDIRVNIGVGNAYTHFSEIKKSYIEAEKALKVVKAEDSSDETIFYSNTGAYKILTGIENIDILKEYYDDTVGILEKYDTQYDTDYAKVFYIYLEENGNYAKTSQRLYMHRNTLMYKINKIQEIIKRDLTDAKVKLEFYLGYMIKKINRY